MVATSVVPLMTPMSVAAREQAQESGIVEPAPEKAEEAVVNNEDGQAGTDVSSAKALFQAVENNSAEELEVSQSWRLSLLSRGP